MRSLGSLRIGIADLVDPRDVQGGSGASASLAAALEGIVAEVVPLSGELPARVGRLAYLGSVATRLRPGDVADLRGAARRVHGAARLGRGTIAARTVLMRRRVASAGTLDAVIQRCSDVPIPAGVRVVTLEDSTVRQALSSQAWTRLEGLTRRDALRYEQRQRRAYESAVACCCATHWVAESIVGSYGVPRERVFTVGMGQNHEGVEPNGRDWRVPRYLFVGVDWERKNGPSVLAAFARVRERHPEAELDVVGGHPPIDQPGVRTHGLLSLARSEDRSHMASLFAAATAFVMPSLHEPAGLVYVEAAGAGVPSIGTTNGGAATMIGPGGLVVDPLSLDEITEAMLTLAEPGTAQRLGELARRHSSLFTWQKVAERVIRAMAIPDVDTSSLAKEL